MDRATRQWNIPEGANVYGSDGDKIGKVIGIYPGYVVVEKGFFFPTDYYIPIAAVASFDGDHAYLNVTKEEALNSGWDIAPSETGAAAYDASGTAAFAEAREDLPRDSGATDEVAGAAAAFGATDHMGESETSPGLAGDLTDEHAVTD